MKGSKPASKVFKLLLLQADGLGETTGCVLSQVMLKETVSGSLEDEAVFGGERGER